MAATEEQMEMAFMQDDGMDVDPVSGNEIPPGSMANEVRDDIPAQLSEGEYVVPADVVRFFGVKFFEDLRSQAKMGMAEMQADGRIGGEPIPAEGEILLDYEDDDLSDDEKALLNEITGMAAGGMATKKKVYAAEGVDLDPYTPQFTSGMASLFAPGYLLQQTIQDTAPPVTGAPVEEVTLYGPNGEIVKLTLPADQARYDELIAMGYTTTAPSTPAATQPTAAQDDVAPLTAAQRAELVKTEPWYERTDWSTTDMPKEGAGEALINMIPGVGTVASMGNIADQYAKANILDALGRTGDADVLRKNISDYVAGSGLGTRIAANVLGDYADGDWKTREAFESVGLSIPEGLKDTGMRDWIRTYAQNNPEGVKKLEALVAPESTETTAEAEAPEPTQAEKTSAAKAATQDWVEATNLVKAAGNDPIAQHHARMAQAEASRAATKAIQEASGWSGGFFGSASNPNWRDEMNKGGLMNKKRKRTKKKK